MALYIGIRFPWRKGATTLPDTVEDSEVIRQSIREIITTSPLEREMRPEFGVNLYELVFENNDQVTAELTRVRIATAISRYEPRVLIQSLTVTPRETNQGQEITIVIFYVVKATQQVDSVEVPLSLKK